MLKRLSLVAGSMWASWILLIALEVFLKAPTLLLAPLYIISIAAMAGGTAWAMNASSDSTQPSGGRELAGFGLGALLFALTLLLGLVFGVNFKFLIGGSL